MEANVETRERRRDPSWRYARRAQRTHLRVLHPTGDLDCPCEASVWYFEKRKALGCRCRSRKAGNPKVGTGSCHGHDYRAAVVERIAGRREARAWEDRLASGLEADDVEL